MQRFLKLFLCLIIFLNILNFKIRAQATVLKRAVLEEQNKNACLRESLRLKELSLRRSEQELDNLGFRNKQLEFRVINFQEDLAGSSSNKKRNNDKNVRSESFLDDSVIEELQKKTLKNAQLTFVVGAHFLISFRFCLIIHLIIAF